MRTLVNLGPLGPIFAAAPGRFEPSPGSLRHVAVDHRRFDLPVLTLPDRATQPPAPAESFAEDEYLKAA